MITGGTSGLGNKFAKLCVEKGANVCIISRRKLESKSIKSFSCDLGRKDVIEQLDPILNEISETFEKIDLLVCCAGFCKPGFIRDLDQKYTTEMMNLNFFGTYYVIKKSLEHMEKGASIVSVSSAMALCGFSGYSGYSASKWALRGLMESLKEEYKGTYNLHIFYPPNMDTPGYKKEEGTKPKVTKAFDRLNVTMKPEDAAQALYIGIENGDFTITATFSTMLMAAASQGTVPIITPFYHPARILLHLIAFFVPPIVQWQISKIKI